jgi:BTB/POZ domain
MGMSFAYFNQGIVHGCENFINSFFVKDGSVTIQYDLAITKPFVEGATKKILHTNTTFRVATTSRILNHMFQSRAAADVSFKVKDETIPAIRNILAACSSVFHAELFGFMRESKDGYYIGTEIEEMEPEVFKAIVLYIPMYCV